MRNMMASPIISQADSLVLDNWILAQAAMRTIPSYNFYGNNHLFEKMFQSILKLDFPVAKEVEIPSVFNLIPSDLEKNNIISQPSIVLEPLNKKEISQNFKFPTNDKVCVEIIQNKTAECPQKMKNFIERAAKIPIFGNLEKTSKKSLLQANQLWNSEKFSTSQMKQFKNDLIKEIYIPDLDDEQMCELMRENECDIQKTLKYCRERKFEIQKKIIAKNAIKSSSHRKTRNSLFHKHFEN